MTTDRVRVRGADAGAGAGTDAGVNMVVATDTTPLLAVQQRLGQHSEQQRSSSTSALRRPRTLATVLVLVLAVLVVALLAAVHVQRTREGAVAPALNPSAAAAMDRSVMATNARSHSSSEDDITIVSRVAAATSAPHHHHHHAHTHTYAPRLKLRKHRSAHSHPPHPPPPAERVALVEGLATLERREERASRRRHHRDDLHDAEQAAAKADAKATHATEQALHHARDKARKHAPVKSTCTRRYSYSSSSPSKHSPSSSSKHSSTPSSQRLFQLNVEHLHSILPADSLVAMQAFARDLNHERLLQQQQDQQEQPVESSSDVDNDDECDPFTSSDRTLQPSSLWSADPLLATLTSPQYRRTPPASSSPPTALNADAVADDDDDGERAHTVLLADTFHVMYTARVSIGTPAQEFDIILDTGSSCLWVVSALNPLATHISYLHFYDHVVSSSWVDDGRAWSIEYGVGQCKGVLGNETVSVGDLRVTDQTFAEATALSSNFLNPHQPLDGILGMAFSGGACAGWPTFLDNAQAQGQLTQRVFSFRLVRGQGDADDDATSSDGESESSNSRSGTTDAGADVEVFDEVIFGAPDVSAFVGPLVWTEVLHAPHKAPHMWFVHLEGMSVLLSPSVAGTLSDGGGGSGDDDDDDASIAGAAPAPAPAGAAGAAGRGRRDSDGDSFARTQLKSRTRTAGDPLPDVADLNPAGLSYSFCGPLDIPCIALPDTGTSFLTVPTRMFIMIVQSVTLNRQDCVMDQQMNVFCLDGPDDLPDLLFTFNGHEFVLSPSDYLLPNRQLAIQVLDFGLPGLNILILGDAFLRAVYTVFDADALRVGFAQARHPGESSGGGGAGAEGNAMVVGGGSVVAAPSVVGGSTDGNPDHPRASSSSSRHARSHSGPSTDSTVSSSPSIVVWSNVLDVVPAILIAALLLCLLLLLIGAALWLCCTTLQHHSYDALYPYSEHHDVEEDEHRLP